MVGIGLARAGGRRGAEREREAGAPRRGLEAQRAADRSLTSIVSVLRFAEHEQLIVERLDGGAEYHRLDALGDNVTEDGNPENCPGVGLAIVELKHPLLSAGLQL